MNGYASLCLLSTVDKDNPYSTEGPTPALAGGREIGASQAESSNVLKNTQHYPSFLFPSLPTMNLIKSSGMCEYIIHAIILIFYMIQTTTFIGGCFSVC